MELIRIKEGGYFPELVGCGNGDLACDGVVIDAPGEVVVVGRLSVSHVRVPLVVKRVGKLLIDLYQPFAYWGDTANFRCGHIHINDFWPDDILQQFEYDQYHQDVIFQSYATQEDGYTLDPQGIIEHIYLNRVRVYSGLQRVNGVMLSERNVYRNLHIGMHELDVSLEAPWWFSANSLQDSVLGGMGGVQSVRSTSGLYEPDVRILDVKESGHGSFGNMLFAAGEQAIVPKGAALVQRCFDRV